jgi:hypothetical protein
MDVDAKDPTQIKTLVVEKSRTQIWSFQCTDSVFIRVVQLDVGIDRRLPVLNPRSGLGQGLMSLLEYDQWWERERLSSGRIVGVPPG